MTGQQVRVRNRKPSRLFCFDFDGTITRAEVLPIVAREIGLYEEFRVLTKATIEGILPLYGSLKLRFKLLENIPVSEIEMIILEQVPLHEELLRFLNENAGDCCVITANLDSWLRGLIGKRLQCPVFASRTTVRHDRVCAVDFIDKRAVVRRLGQERDEVVVVGEGVGDAGMFEEADVGIAFGGVHAPVESIVEHSNFVVNSEVGLCKLLRTL